MIEVSQDRGEPEQLVFIAAGEQATFLPAVWIWSSFSGLPLTDVLESAQRTAASLAGCHWYSDLRMGPVCVKTSASTAGQDDGAPECGLDGRQQRANADGDKDADEAEHAQVFERR